MSFVDFGYGFRGFDYGSGLWLRWWVVLGGGDVMGCGIFFFFLAIGCGCHNDGYGWWSGGGGGGGCSWLLRFTWMFIIIILMSSLYYFNQSGKKIESLMLLGVLK